MASTISAGDTAYVIVSGALVLLMTPGLGLFYGGMVGEKNVLNTLMLSMVAMSLLGVQWLTIGYALAFGKGNGFIGGGDFYGAMNVDHLFSYAPYGDNLPHLVFWWFQLTFAMITPALISGTVIGRMRMRTWIIFTLVWATIVYDPVAHWVWSAWESDDGEMKYGWLREAGVLDFAGGAVVHLTSGFSALAAALVIGQPCKLCAEDQAHSIPLVFIGTALLWFGWNGFNGGSALAADGIAALATVNTNLSACMGMLTWMALDAYYHKPTSLGAMTGTVVGLATITPAAGFVRPLSALCFGAVGAVVSFMMIKHAKRGIADTLDCFFCHGTSGVVGMVMLGLFAEKDMNPGGDNGLFFAWDKHGGIFFGYQLLATVVVSAYSFVLTYVILTACKHIPIIGLRPSNEKEVIGLDVSMHGEFAMDSSRKKSDFHIEAVEPFSPGEKKAADPTLELPRLQTIVSVAADAEEEEGIIPGV